MESSKCGQSSTLLLMAGRERVEVSPPLFIFCWCVCVCVGGGGGGGRNHPISQKCIVPALLQ